MSKTLIVSISGIRGIFGNGLDADVLVRFAGGYGTWCKTKSARPLIVIGRDGRVTGPLCSAIVTSTLRSLGCDVIDAGLAATPTVEMAVIKEEATGGIIVSASHNPEEWNALKLLNGRGEFLSPEITTAKEMQEFCIEKMKEQGMSRFTAWLFTRGIPKLKRWK